MIKNSEPKKQDVKKLKKKPNALNKKTKAATGATTITRFLKKTPLVEKKNDKAPTTLRWIDLLRGLKLKQLKRSIDEEMNNYEINKNINDKLLLFLNDDLEGNIILEKIDELKNSKLSVLVDIHRENMNSLQKHFEEEVSKLFANFVEDQNFLLKTRSSIIYNVNLFYKQLEENKRTREGNLKKEELEIMNEIYKNYIAERYISNYKFDKFKDEDERTFNNLLVENKKILHEGSEIYHSVKGKYEKIKKSLLSKEREVHDLEVKIGNWKLKLDNEIKIYEMQIERLKGEKTQLLNHIRAIKLILQKLKHNDKQRLIDITTNSRKCINKLEENISLANRLIKTNNLCRNYETEREQLFSSRGLLDEKKEDVPIESLPEGPLECEKERMEQKAHLLENLFKRKNKAILDIIILKKELHELKKKNKGYQKIIDEMDNKLNFNRKVKINKEEFIIRPM
ncbi:hypothetical protein, conserved [Plasmodium ovale curtisi]|nr:hypothetical protein, conserved [Plasmodium ovale curtisi]